MKQAQALAAKHFPRLSQRLQQNIVKANVWLHNSSTIIDLLPLLSPAVFSFSLTAEELQWYDFFLLTNLCIHGSENTFVGRPTLTEVRSKTKESKLTPYAVVVFWLKQTKQRNTKSALRQYHHKRELHLGNLNFTFLRFLKTRHDSLRWM